MTKGDTIIFENSNEYQSQLLISKRLMLQLEGDVIVVSKKRY